MVASFFGYAVTTGLLYFVSFWFGVMNASLSQLVPQFVAIVSLIDSLFGWGVFLVPVSFSYRPPASPSRRLTICLIGAALGCVITALETWMLLVDPRYRTSGVVYILAGALNAALAASLLLALRRASARHNEN